VKPDKALSLHSIANGSPHALQDTGADFDERLRMDRHVGPNEWLSLSLALVGGYADVAGFVIAKTFTGHVTGSVI
jgi:hypothetical protein